MVDDANDANEDGSESFGVYSEYNKVLRTWFVAFGIGGPALLLVNDNVARRLADAHELRLVAGCFLLGVALQVVGALVNKIANWYVYATTMDDNETKPIVSRFAGWLVQQFWIDIAIDLLTIGLFGYAAWLMFTVFALA